MSKDKLDKHTQVFEKSGKVNFSIRDEKISDKYTR